VEQKIVKPLGLKCTGFVPDALPCSSAHARGYAGDQPTFIRRGQPVPDWHFTPLMRGAAGMYSTAKDLLLFAGAHLNGQKTRFNTVLARDMQVRFPQATRAGAIAWVVDDIEGAPITYQIGIVAGYTSYIGIDAKHKTAVVVMQNSFNWDSSVGHKMLLGLRYMTAQPGLNYAPTPLSEKQ
jgi:CubicO group peptidase (beta-lactamase class C family)